MHPVDVPLALRLAQSPDSTYEALRDVLGVSASTAHASVQRLAFAGLMLPGERRTNRLALLEFLEHGIRYAFPAVPGAVRRGVATAFSVATLGEHLDVSEEPLVWPSVDGGVRGQSVEPLYPQAIELPVRCESLYTLLALVDVLRLVSGRARERRAALDALREGMMVGHQTRAA